MRFTSELAYFEVKKIEKSIAGELQIGLMREYRTSFYTRS